jgi:hypothetical protein
MDIVTTGAIPNEMYQGKCENCGCIAKFHRSEGTYTPRIWLNDGSGMVTVKCPTEKCASHIHGQKVAA